MLERARLGINTGPETMGYYATTTFRNRAVYLTMARTRLGSRKERHIAPAPCVERNVYYRYAVARGGFCSRRRGPYTTITEHGRGIKSIYIQATYQESHLEEHPCEPQLLLPDCRGYPIMFFN